MELHCVNGPGSGLLVPRHEERKATWIMKWGILEIPLCDDCKELMEPWEKSTFTPVRPIASKIQESTPP